MSEPERQGPGRRPEEDKKVQVAVYIKQSYVDALGGMAAARIYATDKLETQAKLIQADRSPRKRSRHV